MKLEQLRDILIQIFASTLQNLKDDNVRAEVVDVLDYISNKLNIYTIAIPGYADEIHSRLFKTAVSGGFIRTSTMELLLNVAHADGYYTDLVRCMIDAHRVIIFKDESIAFPQHKSEFAEVNEEYLENLLIANPWIYFVLITNMLLKPTDMQEIIDQVDVLNKS